jgi:cell division protein FtsW
MASTETTSPSGATTGQTSALAAFGRMLRRPLASYYIIAGAAALLLILGLAMVFSASSDLARRETGSSTYYLIRQGAWTIAGIGLAWLLTRMPIRYLRRLSTVAIVLALVLLALTFVPGLGITRGGNRNWLDFGGPFLLQPSEPAKLALILWGAHVYANKGRALAQWKNLLMPFLPVAAIVVALVIGQHDLGTAVILMGIVLVMLWAVGVPTWLFSLALGVVGVVGVYFVMSSENRRNRFLTFLDPMAHFQDSGYQSGFSIYAFANGGWWGTGPGASSMKSWLPEPHTDFIFAIIGEELGLPGALMVLVLFLGLIFGGLRIAMRTKDLFVRLTAAGITGWLMLQMIVNLGSVLAVLPVIGVPLPLVSYGGASMVVTILAVGILLVLAKEEPGARAALAARREARARRRS